MLLLAAGHIQLQLQYSSFLSAKIIKKKHIDTYYSSIV